MMIAFALAACTGASERARAAGFASSEFGGEQGNVVTSNPTALYFNPAGVAFSEGTNLYLGGVLALRHGTWTHAQAASEAPDPPGAVGADTGEARFFNVFGAPVVGATTRIGALAIGAGAYVPFGGHVHWDENSKFAGSTEFPVAVGGVQRWTLTEGALTYLYGTVGAAYRMGPVAVGVTGNLVRSSILVSQSKSTNPALQVDPSSEYQIRIDVSGTEASFGLGLMWEAVADHLWLGASYQSQPNLGAMKLTGTLARIQDGQSAFTPVTYTQALPDVIRLGARFRPNSVLELRLYGDLTRWSRLQTECVSTEGQPCAVFPSGADATPSASTIQNVRRSWNDTYEVRVGVSYWLRPTLELYAGGGFETAAAPDATLDPALPDANNVRAALGGRIQLGHGLAISAGFTDVQYFARDNTGKSTLANAAPPTQRADAGGRYTLWLGLINLGVEKRW